MAKGQATAAGVATGNPYLAGAGIVADVLGAGLMGGGKEEKMGNLHLVNPQQQLLYNKMLQGLLGGGGDFGYGSNIKAGTSQLQNMMAQRGIKIGSGGAYSGAYGNMVGNALGQDAQARRQYAMGLLQSPLQTATVTGANLIPGSTSAGYSPGAQEGSWNLYHQTGYVQPGVGMRSGTGPGGNSMAYPSAAANRMTYDMDNGGGAWDANQATAERQRRLYAARGLSGGNQYRGSGVGNG